MPNKDLSPQEVKDLLKHSGSFLYVDKVPTNWKTDWLRAAAAAGLPFAEWVQRELNKAVKKDQPSKHD